MKTGGITNTGAGRKKPITHYLDKHYPIKGRKDFYKWTIVTPKGLAKDYKGDIMYFDEFNLELAKITLRAIKATVKINKNFKSPS